MAGRPRRSAVRMTLDEAERIVALDQEGRLERDDAEVAKVVFEAYTVSQRAALWGAEPGHPTVRRNRWIIVATVVFMAVWIAGLLVPLLIEANG